MIDDLIATVKIYNPTSITGRPIFIISRTHDSTSFYDYSISNKKIASDEAKRARKTQIKRNGGKR